MTMISPSILAGNLADIRTELKQLEDAGADLVHIDVMDGHFVPNLTFGPKFTSDLKARTTIPLDIHLMVQDPFRWTEAFIGIGPYSIIFHIEATALPVRLLLRIREAGIKAGIAVNPSTPLRSIIELLPMIDIALIMTVEPGFYGQAFLPDVAGKIRLLKRWISARRDHILISVDGGVSEKNSDLLIDYGADILVAGGYIFAGDYRQRIAALRKKHRKD